MNNVDCWYTKIDESVASDRANRTKCRRNAGRRSRPSNERERVEAQVSVRQVRNISRKMQSRCGEVEGRDPQRTLLLRDHYVRPAPREADRTRSESRENPTQRQIAESESFTDNSGTTVQNPLLSKGQTGSADTGSSERTLVDQEQKDDFPSIRPRIEALISKREAYSAETRPRQSNPFRSQILPSSTVWTK